MRLAHRLTGGLGLDGRGMRQAERPGPATAVTGRSGPSYRAGTAIWVDGPGGDQVCWMDAGERDCEVID